MSAYLKMFAAVAATVLSAAVAALVDNHMSTAEWVNLAIAFVTACSVFTAANVPGARYTKLILAALGAGLALLVSFITDGVSTSEWMQILIAMGGAVGVGVVPNAPTKVQVA